MFLKEVDEVRRRLPNPEARQISFTVFKGSWCRVRIILELGEVVNEHWSAVNVRHCALGGGEAAREASHLCRVPGKQATIHRREAPFLKFGRWTR
jgi:hypothetical protein